MARTKNDEEPAKKKTKTAKDDDGAVEADGPATHFDIDFPADEASFSVTTREAFRSTYARGHFFPKCAKVEQSARIILSRLHNGQNSGKAGFVNQFKKEFSAWATKPTKNPKQTRPQLLVKRYTEFLSSIVTSIKKWHEHPTTVTDPEDAPTAMEGFVLISRVTFIDSASQLILKSGSGFSRLTESQAVKNFKNVYKVRKSETHFLFLPLTICFSLQDVGSLGSMVRLISEKPEETDPFVTSTIYPSFAIFAAFFGEPVEDQRWFSVKKLCEGKPLFEVVPNVTDRAWLFLVYITFCAHLHAVSDEKGWYYTASTASKLKHISAWMQEEDKLKEAHEKAAEAITEALSPLQTTLEASMLVIVDGDTENQENEDDDL